MPVRYRNAPLVEAIFEFAPEGARLSDEGAQRILAVFGDYTGLKEDLRPMVAEFHVPSGHFSSAPGVPRLRQWNQERSRMVQFGADLCAFNALPKYTTFEDYVPDMERLVTTYQSQIGSERTSYLGHRYLNQIAIPNEDPGRYFNLFPGGAQPERRPRPFAIQMEVETLTSGGNLMMTLAYQGQVDGAHRYLLDLYARVGQETAIPFRWEDMIAWQRTAHASIERAFEQPLTELCRQMLGREES
jgi:uncharacterized protein (TIGR04255 family)